MTTTPTATLTPAQAAANRARILSRYEGMTTVLDRKSDRSKNHTRGARRKTTRATRTIL